MEGRNGTKCILCVQSLGVTLSAIHKYASSRLMFPAGNPI